jgi:hypothetical protein
MADQQIPTAVSMMDESDVSDLQATIKERIDQSTRWFIDNFAGEFEEVWRAYKCRVKPIYKKDRAGNELKEEDKSRTNVAMPDINVIIRRNTARLTANMPKINYRGPDQAVADMLTTLSYQQWDRSGETRHHRRVVQGSETFGFYYSKVNWDEVTLTLPMKRDPEKHFKNYSDILKFKGTPEDQIKAELEQRPSGDTLTEEDRAQAMATLGTPLTVRESMTKYEGPVVKSVFPGDFSFDQYADCLNESDWCSERAEKDDLWLKKMKGLTFSDPETGQKVLAFDPKKCEELIDSKPVPLERDRSQDLKRILRDITDKTDMRADAMQDRRLKLGKRIKFTVDEYHEMEDGCVWITWVANEKQVIGRMPYPVDLGGKFMYTELVPLPDLISAYGDATPRLLRFLWNMHNATVAQNYDYVTALLKPFLLVQGQEDVSTDAVQRGNFRELHVKDIRNFLALTMPGMPPSAFEREGQILRMFGIAEPSLNNIDTGSAANPLAGKLATTALLAAKASDAFTQFKLDSQNIYLKELCEKKLAMNQQLGSGWKLSAKYPRSQALTERYGKTAAIDLDVLAIQDFYEVEPEAGSMLAVNDELKRAAAQDLMITAQANPDIINRRKAVEFQLGTIPGIGNVQDYIIPENPAPPSPEAKVNVSVSINYKDLPPQVQADTLQKLLGEPLPPDAVQEINDKSTMQGVEDVSRAANAAHDMVSPQPSSEQLAGTKPANARPAV